MADSRNEEFEERGNPQNETHVRDEETKKDYQNAGKGSQPVQSLMACYRTDLPSVEEQLEVAKKRKTTQMEDRHKQLDAEYHQKLQKALERKKEHDREEKERIYREARKEQSKRVAVLERKKQQEEEKKKQMMAEYEKRQKQHQAAEERRLQISKSSSPKVLKNQHSPPQLKKSNRGLQKSMTTGDVRKSQKVSSKLKSSTSASSVGPVSSQRNSTNGKATKPSTQPSRPQSTIKPSTQPSRPQSTIKPSTQPSRPQSTIKPSTQPSSLSHTPTVKPSHSRNTTSSSSPPFKPKQLTSTPKTHSLTSKVQSVKKTSTSSPQEQKKAVHSTQSPKLRKRVSQPSPATKVTVKKSLSHSGQKASSPRSARKEHHSKEMTSTSDHHLEMTSTSDHHLEMTSTSDHHLEGMTSTSDHHPEEMMSTSDHHLEMTSTSDHHPEEMMSTSDHHLEEITSTTDHHPGEMTSTSDYHPGEMTSTTDHHPGEMTSTSDHHLEMTSTSDHHPGEMTSTTDHHPGEMTSTSDHHLEMTSTSDHHPGEMTSTSDHHLEEMTSTSDHHLEMTSTSDHHPGEMTSTSDHHLEGTSTTEIAIKDETARTVPQFEDVEVGQSSEELTPASVVPSVSVSQVTSEGCDVDGNTLESLDGKSWVQNENRNKDENENRDETNRKSESLCESEKLDLSRCQNENENLDKYHTAHPQRTQSLKHVSSASALELKHSFRSGALDVPTVVFRRHSDGPSRERKRVVLDQPLVLPVVSATPQLPQDEKTEQSVKEGSIEVPLIVHPLRLGDASVNELEEGEECSDEETEEDVRRAVRSAMVDTVMAQTLEEKARLLEKLSIKKSADSALWPVCGDTVDVDSNHNTTSVVEDDGGDVGQNPTKALHRMQSNPDIPPEETMDELGEEVRIRKTSAPALMTKKTSVDFEGMQISTYSGPLDHLPPYTGSFESLDKSLGEHLDISPIKQTTTTISSEMLMSTPFFQDATGGGFDAVSDSDLHEDNYQFGSNVGDDVVSDSDEDDSYQLRSNVIMDDVVSDSDEDDSHHLRSNVVDEVVSDSDEDDSYQLWSDVVDEVVSDSDEDESYQLRSNVVDDVVSDSDEDESYQLPSNVVVDEVVSDSDENESYQLRSNVVDDVVSDSDEDENARKLPSFKMLPKKDSFILFKDTLSPPSPKDVENLFNSVDNTTKKDSIVLPPIPLPPPPLKGILKSRSKDTPPASTAPTSTTIPIDEVISSDGEDNNGGGLKASDSPVGYSFTQLEADSPTVNATFDSGGAGVRSGSTRAPHSRETHYQDVLCSSDDSEDEDNEIHDSTHPLAITSGLPTSPLQPPPPVDVEDGSISHDTGGTVHEINTEQTTVEKIVPMDDVVSSSDSDELVADSYDLETSIPVIRVQHPSTGDSNQEDEPPVSPPGHHEVVSIGSQDDIWKEATAGQVSNSDSDTGFADSVPNSLKFGSGTIYSDEVVSSSESEGDLCVY